MEPADREAYVSRYTARYAEFGYDPRTLGWAKGRQRERFAALLGVAPARAGSVLDVGCGFADLYDYLLELGWEGTYVGLDLVPVLIDEARRRHPSLEVHCGDLLSLELGREFDYVVASGVMNARLSAQSNEEHTRRMLQRMFAHARRAVAVDFMTTLVDFEHPDAFHTDPGWLLAQALQLTRRVTLRHDYLPYEFCAYLYRDDRIAEGSRYQVGYGPRGEVRTHEGEPHD